MNRRDYRAWTPAEEASLLQWVNQHLDLSWKERAREYSATHKPRSDESLRSKLGQLLKGIQRQRPINNRGSKKRNSTANTANTAKMARKRQRREAPLPSVYMPQTHGGQEGDEGPGPVTPAPRSQLEGYTSPPHWAHDRLSQCEPTASPRHASPRHASQKKHHGSWPYCKSLTIWFAGQY